MGKLPKVWFLENAVVPEILKSEELEQMIAHEDGIVEVHFDNQRGTRNMMALSLGSDILPRRSTSNL